LAGEGCFPALFPAWGKRTDDDGDDDDDDDERIAIHFLIADY